MTLDPRRRPPLALVAGLLATLALALPWTAVQAEGSQVRVVLDLSKSLRKNDPGRLAVLATQLLYDLVDPNPRLPIRPDSFEVYAFDADWREWTDPAAAPPASTRAPIVAQAQTPQARRAFAQALAQLPYDGPWTYFYPGLRRALESLRSVPGHPEDIRAIVLVTDGLPEDRTREAERERLAGLRRALAESGIRLYVLAFGELASRHHDFFEDLIQGPDGRSLGRVFVDPDGRGLLPAMLEIFSVGFGYTAVPPRPAAALRGLDLDGGETPTKVAVVALAAGARPPSLALTPRPNAPGGVVQASQPGASYALQWVLGPRVGDYALATDNPAATVALLRPVRPLLQIRPGRIPPDREMRQAERVMAGARFSLRALIGSAAGTAGRQPDLDLSFRTLGPRTGPCAFRWSGDKSPPARDSAVATPEGSAHELWMQFEEDPTDPDRPYRGFVELEAKSGDRTVAALGCERAHELTVFPRIAIVPAPREAPIAPAPLAPLAQGQCVDFTLTADRPARLAALGAEPYGIRASLSVADPGTPDPADAELRGARFSLDNRPLELAGHPLAPPSPWSPGVSLTAAELLGPHRLCLDLGRPRIAATREDLTLALRLALVHPAYEDFETVAPLRVRMSILAPSAAPFDWRALVPLVGVPILLLLGLRWAEPPLALPPDLGYALWPVDPDAPPPGAPSLQPLPPPGLFARLLGRSPPRPLADPLSQEPLAWIRPCDPGLMTLEPAAGMRLAAAEGDDPTPGAGPVAVQVRRIYQLVRTDPDGQMQGTAEWRLRIGYL